MITVTFPEWLAWLFLIALALDVAARGLSLYVRYLDGRLRKLRAAREAQ